MKNYQMENKTLELRITNLERILKLILDQHHMELNKFVYGEAYRILHKEIDGCQHSREENNNEK